MNQAKNIFSLLLLCIAIFAACKKEKNQPILSPSYYIAESEKLIIPTSIDLPAHASGYTRVATLYAKGDQEYKAQQKPGSNPVSYEWVFVAPQADLFNSQNQKVGTHGAGPFWQLSSADSIFAQAFNPPKASPSSDGKSIDWLLLMTKAGKTPTGSFSDVSYIQRIATTGGKAPATPPTNASETTDVPYTAVYRFTKKNP